MRKTSDDLKQSILALVKEYHQVSFPEQTFIPGKSRINYGGRYFDENELVNLVDSSLEFWLTYGHYSVQFESELAKFLGVRWSLLVNSGSSANLLAFMALTSPLLKERRILRGDEVITVAAGFPTTIAPILQYGAVPVFVDVELDTQNINTHALEQAITSKTKAVMIAHTLGNPFDVEAVAKICKNYHLWLIEDNCDALGSTFNGKYTGSFGDIGTSSFYPPHHLTMGEGGATYTSNPLLKKIMLSMRDWGRDCWCDSGKDDTCNNRFKQQFGSLPPGYDHKYVYSHLGYNLKATDMQAAIGCAQLKKLPLVIERRIENHRYLVKHLSKYKNFFTFTSVLPQAVPSWFGFMLILNDSCPFSRNDIVGHLEKANIQTRNLFAGNILRHPVFQDLKENVDYRVHGELTQTDKIMNNGFWVGVYPGMTSEKLDYMIKIMGDYISTKLVP